MAGSLGGVLLAEVAATSRAVAATPARTAKTAALAELLRRTPPDLAGTVAALLAGEPRQGRVGVGWAGLAGLTAQPADSPRLTVEELDAALSRFAALAGPGSAQARAAALHELFGAATAAEQEWLRALLSGEVRQGALEGVLADAVARAAGVPAAAVRRAAMLAGDLPAVAALALGGGDLGVVRLAPLRPVQPMLAATAGSVAEALALTGPASVEWKLDGARVQVHREGDEVRVFTRSLNDVTARLPAVVELARSLPARTVILDGEVIGPEIFQDTMSRFSSGVGELAVWFFDCLHRDGTDLLDAPLAERAVALGQVVGELRIPSLVTADPAAAEAFLEGALAAGHEGVMVKAEGSAYEAGRRGGAWRKVKPVRTADLVVLAAEWGSGRRRGWLSNLHLGARAPDGGFVMVGKTFKGLTDALLDWQTGELLARETHRDAHTVHVRPELVVEVAYDGVQRSTRYAGGVTLRFARVRRYRPDKAAADADRIDLLRTT